MSHTPEGALIKGERNRRQEDLIEAFEKQAGSDLDKHDRYGDLKQDVEKRHPELVPEDNGSDNAMTEIIRKHEKTLRDDKGLDDVDEQKAYVTALVREIQKRKESLH